MPRVNRPIGYATAMSASFIRLDPALWAEVDLAATPGPQVLADALDELRDSGCRAVTFTGEPSFDFDPVWLRSFELFPLPTLFAFEGQLAGSAFQLAIHCDIRICSEPATMRVSGIGGHRMLRLAGPETTVDLLRVRGQADSALALTAGLVSEVTPAGEALDYARRLAATIASRGPIATQLAKEALWRGLEMPLAQGLRMETDLTLLLQTTKDRAEGVAAFLEKRQPRFTGD